MKGINAIRQVKTPYLSNVSVNLERKSLVWFTLHQINTGKLFSSSQEEGEVREDRRIGKIINCGTFHSCLVYFTADDFDVKEDSSRTKRMG